MTVEISLAGKVEVGYSFLAERDKYIIDLYLLALEEGEDIYGDLSDSVNESLIRQHAFGIVGEDYFIATDHLNQIIEKISGCDGDWCVESYFPFIEI